MTNKKKPKYVSEARMAALLSRWARAADASITMKLAELKAELRAEFTVVVPPVECGCTMMHDGPCPSSRVVLTDV